MQARRERQSILTPRENQTKISFVLAESCLNRIYGGPAVMRETLMGIIDVAALPHVQIQVLPESSADSPSYAWLSFQLLHVPGPGIVPPLNFVYIGQLDDARYIDRPDLVEKYEMTWGASPVRRTRPKGLDRVH